MTIFLFVILSGVTFFVELNREELSSMPGGKRIISIGVVDLGVPVDFLFTDIVDLGVTGVVAIGVSGKVSLRVPGNFFFLFPNGYIFTIFFPYSLRPKT